MFSNVGHLRYNFPAFRVSFDSFEDVVSLCGDGVSVRDKSVWIKMKVFLLSLFSGIVASSSSYGWFCFFPW